MIREEEYARILEESKKRLNSWRIIAILDDILLGNLKKESK